MVEPGRGFLSCLHRGSPNPPHLPTLLLGPGEGGGGHSRGLVFSGALVFSSLEATMGLRPKLDAGPAHQPPEAEAAAALPAGTLGGRGRAAVGLCIPAA